MRGKIRGAAALVGALLVFAVLISERASALSYNDIAGKWCTGGGIIQFDPKQLIVVRSADGQRVVFAVQRYEFAETSIKVHWIRADKAATSTTYVEFDADGRKMVQSPTPDGPRREFHRC